MFPFSNYKYILISLRPGVFLVLLKVGIFCGFNYRRLTVKVLVKHNNSIGNKIVVPLVSFGYSSSYGQYEFKMVKYLDTYNILTVSNDLVLQANMISYCIRRYINCLPLFLGFNKIYVLHIFSIVWCSMILSALNGLSLSASFNEINNVRIKFFITNSLLYLFPDKASYLTLLICQSLSSISLHQKRFIDLMTD